jgi:6-phosphogluconolactonase
MSQPEREHPDHSPQIRVCDDLADLAWRAAEYFVQVARESIATNGRFNVALSGGSTPLPTYALLALPEWAARVNWAKTHVYWADERCVPPDDSASNYLNAHAVLLERVPLPPEQIHRMRGEADPAQAAHEYDMLIGDVAFDLILLGMGDDGHTASLFPGTAAVHEAEKLVVAHHVAKVGQWRLTLTPRAINAARHVAFLAGGKNKAERLREVIEGPYQPDVLPAQVVRPTQGKLMWFVDREAAALLKRGDTI